MSSGLLRLIALATAFTSATSGLGAYTAAAWLLDDGKYRLRLFPLNGDPAWLDAPYFHSAAAARDAQVLYAAATSGSRLQKIDLLSLQAVPLDDGNVLSALFAVAAPSQLDEVFLYGQGREPGYPNLLLRLDAPGRPRVLYRQQWNKFWIRLAISPDQHRLLGETRHGLELLQLATGLVTRLPNYEVAAWSPDGKWLAAAKPSLDLTLLDPQSFKRVRDLGKIGDLSFSWSPDSRFILAEQNIAGLKALTCPLFGSLVVIDVATGERREIKSSRCQIEFSGVWWVNDRVYAAAAERRAVARKGPSHER